MNQRKTYVESQKNHQTMIQLKYLQISFNFPSCYLIAIMICLIAASCLWKFLHVEIFYSNHLKNQLDYQQKAKNTLATICVVGKIGKAVVLITLR